MDRYLQRFGEIRRIQEYLVGRAEKQGWPVIEAADPDQALLAVMDLILERATARAGRGTLSAWHRRSRDAPGGGPVRAWSRCPCTDLAAVTERSALAAGRFLGRGDAEVADQAASEAMREALDAVPISGTLVIGRDDEGHAAARGHRAGRAAAVALDLACDPVGNGTAVAGGRPGALSILAASDPGGLMPVPRMYMRKMAVGPVAKGRIDLRRPVGENLEAIADAFGRRVADVTAIVLDRPRHDDLVAEIREAGARIKLIADGDIMASISAAIRGTNDHLAIGIGGAHGGHHRRGGPALPGRRDPGPAVADEPHRDQPRRRGRDRRRRAASSASTTSSAGTRPWSRRASPAATCCGACATWPTAPGRSRSSCCSRCNRVRFIDSIHLFSGDRHEEIRL